MVKTTTDTLQLVMEATPAALPIMFEPIKAVVLDSLTSLESKRVYSRGIDRFFSWIQSERPSAQVNKAAVQAFRSHLIAASLSSSTINLYLTAIRRLAIEAADAGLLTSE